MTSRPQENSNPNAEALLLAALGIDKGKMLGVPLDGILVHQDPRGARITVELVGFFDHAMADRLRNIITTGTDVP